MKKLYFILFLSALLVISSGKVKLNAQMPPAISIQPQNATFYDEITLTFDPDLACFQSGSLSGLPYVAMHSGVTVNGNNWQYVVAFNSTGGNGQSPILNTNPDGTYSITFIPYEFYQFPAGASVTQICAVFNNGSNWNQDGRDFEQGGTNCKDFFIPINTGSPYLPALSSIVPNQGVQGESVNVQIFGINTHFVNGSTQIWIEKNSGIINVSSYYAANDTLIAATIVIPADASLGFWTLKVVTPNDGSMMLNDAFKIISSGGTMPAAITIFPSDATAYDNIVLTFNPDESCYISGSLSNADQIFMHSGIAFVTGENWQYVVDFNGTGANNQQPQLSSNGDGTWSIYFNPSEFYGFPAGSVVTHICAVFNDGTWNNDGRDFESGTPNCTDFFIPLNYTTGITPNRVPNLIISPNPVSDYLRIDSDISLVSYQIMNIMGKVVKEAHCSTQKSLEIDLRNFPSGIYFMMVKDIQGSVTNKKLLKN